MNALGIAVCAVVGGVLGVPSSLITRHFVPRIRAARLWWPGALATAIVMGSLAWRVGDRGELAVYGFVAVLGVPLAVIDWVSHRLPRIVVWPQLGGAVLGFALLCLVRGDFEPGVRAVCAMLTAAGLFLLLAVLIENGVGAGDVSLAGVIGLVAGWSGWPQVAGTLLLASLCALAVLAVLRVRRGAAVAVPFGPCLLTAMLAVVALG